MNKYLIQPPVIEYVYKEIGGNINALKKYLQNSNMNNDECMAIYNWFCAAYFKNKDTLGVFNLKNALKELNPSKDFDYLANAPITWAYNNSQGKLFNEDSNKLLNILSADDAKTTSISFLKNNLKEEKYGEFLMNILSLDDDLLEHNLEICKDELNSTFSNNLKLIEEIEQLISYSKVTSIDALFNDIFHKDGTPEGFDKSTYDLIKEFAGTPGALGFNDLSGKIEKVKTVLTDENIFELTKLYYNNAIVKGDIEWAYDLGNKLKKTPKEFGEDIFNGESLEKRMGAVLKNYKKNEKEILINEFNKKHFKQLKENFSIQNCLELAYDVFNSDHRAMFFQTFKLGDEYLKNQLRTNGIDYKDFKIELFRHFYEKDHNTNNFERLSQLCGKGEPSKELVAYGTYCKYADIIINDFEKLLSIMDDGEVDWTKKDEKGLKKACKKLKSLYKQSNLPKKDFPSNKEILENLDYLSKIYFKQKADKSIKKLLKSKFKNPITNDDIKFDLEEICKELTTDSGKNLHASFEKELDDIRENISKRLVEKYTSDECLLCCDNTVEDYCGIYLTALLNAHKDKLSFNKGSLSQDSASGDDAFDYFNNPEGEMGQFIKKGVKMKLTKKHEFGIGEFMEGDLTATEDVLDYACTFAKGGKAVFHKNVGNELGTYSNNLNVVVAGNVGNESITYSKNAKIYFKGKVGEGLCKQSKKCNVVVDGDVGDNALENAVKTKAKFKGSVGNNLGKGSKKCEVEIIRGHPYSYCSRGSISEDMLSGKLTIPKINVNEDGGQTVINGFLARKMAYSGTGFIGAGTYLLASGLATVEPFNYLSGILLAGGSIASAMGWAINHSGKKYIKEHNQRLDELINGGCIVESEKKLNDTEVDLSVFEEKIEAIDKDLDEVSPITLELNRIFAEENEYQARMQIESIKKAYLNGEIGEGFYNIYLQKKGIKKACPSCGMEVEYGKNSCPICNHDFENKPAESRRIIRKPIKRVVRRPGEGN